MTYYHQLKSISGIHQVPTIENVDFTNNVISIEGSPIAKVWEAIKTIFKKIKDFAINFYKWMKDRLLWFVKLFKTKDKKLKTIDKLNKEVALVDKNELRDLAYSFFELQHGSSTEFMKMFSNNGKLFELNNVINLINKNRPKLNLDVDLNDVDSIKVKSDELYQASRTVDKDIGSNFNSFQETDIFRYVDKIEQLNAAANSFYNKEYKIIEANTKKLEHALDKLDIKTYTDYRLYGRINDLLKSYYRWCQTTTYPVTLVYNYIRLVRYLGKEFVSLKRVTTTNLNISKLYHVSNDDKLTEVYPRISHSNTIEFLPPRISFAEDFKFALYGVPHAFKGPVKSEDAFNRHTYHFYVYEYIPKKGVTTYINPKIVKSEVFLTEAFYSNEIAVVGEDLKLGKTVKEINQLNQGKNSVNVTKKYKIEVVVVSKYDHRQSKVEIIESY